MNITPENLIYRKIVTSELKDALTLVKAVFMRFEAPEYPSEGVAAFLEYIEPDAITEKVNNGELTFWGCFKDDDIIGVCASRSVNHVCLMFVDEAFHRLGIARRLFDLMVKDVKLLGDYSDITVNSSPYAVPFYRSVGFIETSPEKTINGIRHIPMRCQL